tara:strand:+ start:344 stop:634 length:291 start_codon:yes stop_codon:yes gene_type:complete
MIGRLLYMIPFFGMVTASYFIWTADIRSAVILAGLALTQSLICFVYLMLQIIASGTNGTLEVEVELRDALIPVIFLTLSASTFLLITTQLAEAFAL